MGYIKDKRFVTQPTKEVIDAALEADENSPAAFIGGLVKGVIGGGDEFWGVRVINWDLKWIE